MKLLVLTFILSLSFSSFASERNPECKAMKESRENAKVKSEEVKSKQKATQSVKR